MNEFKALSIKTLVFVPVLLGAAPSLAAMPESLPIAERDSSLLAQSTQTAAELPSGIQSGSDRTLVTTEGSVTQIEGGVRAGSNLFHRFDGFGIGVGETADFAVQEATQAVFGQVAGGGASYINGQIKVSGSDADLYLINPAGILFGPNAQLNLGGSLTATTADQVGFDGDWLDVSASDYTTLTGTPDAYRFAADASGAVVNRAELTVGEGQAIRLVGGDVVNAGSLRAAGGDVTLTAVAGDELRDASAGSLVRLSADGALLSVELANEAVTGGNWNPLSVPELLTGNEAGSAANDLRLNADGSVDLRVADADLGALPVGASEGRVLAAGDVDVSGQVGGSINLFGRTVEVVEGQLNASGELGGGTIQVGGGYRGKGALPTANRVLFGERAIAQADSLVEGDGGQIVLWSDGETQFDGQLSANASGAGAGGLIETSGRRRLEVGQQASVSTQAQSGQLGTWLLDPDDLRVASTTTGAAIVGGTNAPEGASEIDPTVLVTALNGSNVELQANNTITVDAAVDASGNTAGGNLTLNTQMLNLNERITLRPGNFVQPGGAGPATVNVGINGSVQNAVDAVATDGTVNLAAGNYQEASDILVQRNVTLRGQGRTLTAIDGDGGHRVLTLSGVGGSDLSDDISVTIDSLAVRNGSSDKGAGIAVLDGVNLLLTNSLVDNNRNTAGVTGEGGGLFFDQTGSSVIRNTTISNNFTSGTGGGIAVYGSHQLLLENSTLSNNDASRNGGAIDSNSIDAAIEIVGGQLIANSSVDNGGGISINDTYLSIDGTEFTANVAEGRGGAINAFEGTFDIRNSTFSENIARIGSGGAIVAEGNLNVEDSQFENNSAEAGGAIALQVDGTSKIDRSSFYNNNGANDGGAILLDNEHKLTLTGSTIYENTTQGNGGAIQAIGNSLGRLTIVNSTIAKNSAGNDGGGLHLGTEGTVTIEGSTIARNTAGQQGGGLYRTSSSVPTLLRSIIADNSAVNSFQDVRGDFISGGNNLVRDRSGTSGYVDSDLPEDTDPLLGDFADYGGGLLTIALLPGSPAIDAGGTASPGAIDQRGIAIVGARDIGAYEFQAASTRRVGDLFFIAGDGQFATVDADYAALFQVQVLDTLGAALAGIQIDFTLPTTGASGTIDADASTFVTDINGMASLAARANRVAGSYTLLAETADGLASASTAVTNRADVASRFALSGPTSALIAGEAVNFSVTALDRFDNVADSYNSTVSFAGSDSRALLPETSSLTDGVGNFSATPITAGNQTFTVTDTTTPNLVTNVNGINVTAATGEVLSILAGRGQTTTVGSAFSEGLTVRVDDRFGNPVAGEQVVFSGPTTGAGAFLDSETVLTDESGLATATLRANDVAGNYEVIASAIGISGLFGLQNDAAAVVDPVDIPSPVDVTPIDSTAVEAAAENVEVSLTGLMIPTEGMTEMDSSGDSLTEANSQNQQSLRGRSGVFDEVAFAETERLLTEEYAKYWQSSTGQASTLDSVQQTLRQAETHHKAKSAVIYALFVPPGDRNYDNPYPSVLSQRLLRDETQRDRDQLLLVMVPPEGQPVQQLIDVSRSQIERQAQLLGIEISMLEDEGYQPLARQLYGWLLAPIAADLESYDIDNLMYVMDEGLRTIPLAAMMTGDRFAIEEYGISMLPSMGLLNADFDTAPSERNVLTAGADRFEHLEALPAVPVELGLVANASTSAQTLFNEAFSLKGLIEAQADKSQTMVHLATHAAFNAGSLDRSYVQLWDEQLGLNEIAALDLDGLEMLILSACATAMGSRDAELGFAGLAAATGVEASMGSLWNVSDVGTMALMAEFYEQLRKDPLRVTALQQAQLSLLRNETRLENNNLVTQEGRNLLPQGFSGEEAVTFSHPFFWSGFTLIGSPWW